MSEGEMLFRTGQPLPDMNALAAGTLNNATQVGADGLVDSVGVPVPGGGAPFVADDVNGDGTADMLSADVDGDGMIDSIAIDTDGDGLVDVASDVVGGDALTMVDLDSDGIADLGVLDLGADGVADMVSAANDIGADAIAEAAEGGGSLIDAIAEFLSELFG